MSGKIKVSSIDTGAVKKQAFSYIIAALGLIAGLAWNDAIKLAIDALYPLPANSIAAKFIYAVAMTAIVVLASAFFLKEDKQK